MINNELVWAEVELGVRVAVAPDGRPVGTPKDTVPDQLLRLIVTADVADAPWITVAEEGLVESEKFGAF